MVGARAVLNTLHSGYQMEGGTSAYVSMSLTLSAVLVAWRLTSLQHLSAPSGALLPHMTPDSCPEKSSAIYYVCGVGVLTPYALGRAHWAGYAHAQACVGCAFRLAPAGASRVWPFVWMTKLQSLGQSCECECS